VRSAQPNDSNEIGANAATTRRVSDRGMGLTRKQTAPEVGSSRAS
jgi:hypothetical protein